MEIIKEDYAYVSNELQNTHFYVDNKTPLKGFTIISKNSNNKLSVLKHNNEYLANYYYSFNDHINPEYGIIKTCNFKVVDFQNIIELVNWVKTNMDLKDVIL